MTDKLTELEARVAALEAAMRPGSPTDGTTARKPRMWWGYIHESGGERWGYVYGTKEKRNKAVACITWKHELIELREVLRDEDGREIDAAKEVSDE